MYSKVFHSDEDKGINCFHIGNLIPINFMKYLRQSRHLPQVFKSSRAEFFDPTVTEFRH